MAKNSLKQIMEDEKKIIDQLSKNANKSINEIAKNCKFSRQKVWRMIKNLEKNNTIWGYTAVIDERKQDLKSYIVLVKRTSQPLTKNVVEKITKRELVKKSASSGIRVHNSIYTNGFYDWIICFSARDTRDAKRFVEDLNKLFEGYISEVQLLEELFATEKCGIQNPNLDELEQFFIDI